MDSASEQDDWTLDSVPKLRNPSCYMLLHWLK